MRKAILPAVLAIAAIGVVGVYALASASGQRPMNGRLELSGGPTGAACDANSIRIDLSGTGTLAHLGQAEVTASNCTGGDLEAGEADITGGNATYVAADGSTITASYSGHQEAPQGSVAEYTTTHTITGGTGRFANATGTWTVAGTVDLSVGLLLGEVSGWLSY